MFLAQKLGEWFYKNAYPLYHPLYFTYKNISDRNEINYLKKNVKPADVVLDIGANIGFYSLLFSDLVGTNGKVYAFEPEKNNFNKLIQNTKRKTNIHCINAAVADTSGILNLYSSEFGLNVDFKVYKSGNNQIVQTIRAYTIDDFIQEFNIQKLNWIKMDIQGYEYFALSGMTETLKKYPDVKIITELWPYGMKQAGISMEQWNNLIIHLNLNIFQIVNQQLIPFNISDISDNLSASKYYNIVLTT